MKQGSAHQGPGHRTDRLFGAMRWSAGLIGLALVAGLWWVWRGPGGGSDSAVAPVIEDQQAAFSQYAGSASCRDCHADAYALWTKSNHALAERPVRADWDQEAFVPTRSFRHGTQQTEVRRRSGQFQLVTWGFGSNWSAWTVERVIGHDPLRQFLISAPGGRWQVSEASWDPHKKEWFNVYDEEDRRPGEWGHWTGRGMTWNSMCAFCHNTRLRKNYHEATDSYDTRMVEMGVGCEACHGPLRAHVEWRRAFPDVKLADPTLKPLSRDQYFDTCGACHARRAELTGDFKPGDLFLDHYALVTVDATDLFYPDGQVRDEDYEFAAFLGSKMYAAGVRCMDCHQPHAAKPKLPGNALCQRCHTGHDPAFPTSPVIDPETHSFHKPDNAGYLCTGCHMPITVYMQRHPRHDHGFTSPDPLLTKLEGIPNACNRCHTDKDTDWALDWCVKWYGAKMERPARARARLLAAARRGEPASRGGLLELLRSAEAPYWKTAALHLLERWATDPDVIQAALEQLAHTNALVRAAAARVLEPAAGAGHLRAMEALEQALADPVRAVRLAAAWALRHSLDLQSQAGRELLHMLDWSADQPGGQLQKGLLALARQDLSQALAHFKRAVEWDPHSAAIHHDLAVALSMAGRHHEALDHMQQAVRLEPNHAEYHYKLGLAWHELGSLQKTVEALERAVALDPRHARAWYNLGLARHALGQTDQALQALLRAEAADPTDARTPYARATILARLNRIAEARAAAQRALELQPHFPEAELLLQSLGR